MVCILAKGSVIAHHPHTITIRLTGFCRTSGTLPSGCAAQSRRCTGRPGRIPAVLVNWPDVTRHFVRNIEADATADGTAETAALLERLLSYEEVRPLLKTLAAGPAADPVLPMIFRKGEVSLELFTTIATLGTPQDVTLQELRIESFFPMHDGTAAILRAWAR
jgi:hypothetical protein